MWVKSAICNCISFSWLITHAGIAAGMGSVFSRVCLSVCLHSKRKIASAINTKFGTHVLYSSRLACIDPEVKRSRSHGYKSRHGRTVASDTCYDGRVLLLLAWVCMSIRLPVFPSFHVLIEHFGLGMWTELPKVL